MNRVFDLYRKGGLNEVLRGARDFLYYRGGQQIEVRLISTRTLEVEDITVQFVLTTPEDTKRARGHGEKEVMLDFVTEVTEGDSVWDVGANVGTYSLLAAKQGADAMAFEPGQDALQRLRKNCELNDVEERVEVREVALSGENTQAELSDDKKSGHRKLTELSSDSDGVEVRRGDDIDIENPDVIKIDVEGHEVEALSGMVESLSSARACYVEFHDGTYEVASDILSEAGFEETKMFDGDVRGLNLSKFESQQRHEVDYNG